MESQGVEDIKLNQITPKKKASAFHILPRDLSIRVIAGILLLIFF